LSAFSLFEKVNCRVFAVSLLVELLAVEGLLAHAVVVLENVLVPELEVEIRRLSSARVVP